jgi:1-deoxy-D-xylulose-5-phosphate reductoisomerase
VGRVHLGWPPLRPLVILGATGSIGRQTVEVAERIGVPIVALAARTPSKHLLELGIRYPDAVVCVVEPGESAGTFREALGDRAHFGKGAMTEVAAMPGATVVNGVVGAAGLEASLSALYAGNRLALANKESLVAGGSLVRAALESGGGELIPVDSEHSAIWQCIAGENVGSVHRLILTASGGPFRGFSPQDLESVTVEQALAHPTWEMGPRITTDSATLMNKAFEVIEAHYLFDLAYDNIDVVVHPQSIVHSLVEFSDGVVKAEVGHPDMRKPIQIAITHPDRVAVDHEPFDLVGTDLSFERPDVESFPCLTLGYEAGRAGGTATAVLNAADEIAVAAFLDGRLPFTAIAQVVESVLTSHDVREPEGVEDVIDADGWARRMAQQECETVAG